MPNGSKIVFAAGTCYGLDNTLLLSDRSNLAIFGNGTEIKLLTTTSNSASDLSIWNINGGSNISLSGMTLVGDNPSTSEGGSDSVCYPSGSLEWQNGVNFSGTQTARLTNVNIQHMCGDFVDMQAYQEDGNSEFDQPATDITVSGGTMSYAGRQGFSLTDVDGATITGVNVSHVGQAGVDVEPDVDQEVDKDITLTDSQFSYLTESVLANLGQGGAPNVGDITVSDNTETGTFDCTPMVWVGTPAGSAARSGYVVTGNHFAAFTVLAQFQSNVDNITVTNNVDSGAYGDGGCGQNYGLVGDGVSNVTVENNNLGPTVSVLASINGATDWYACGNKVGTAIRLLPIACS